MITIDGFNISIRRGDTGAFDIHTTGYNFGVNDRALFTIKDSNRKAIRRELLEITNNTVTIEFVHADTKSMKVGEYTWDIRFIVDPEYDDNDNPTGGTEIDTPYTDMRFSVGRTVGDI